MEEILFIIMCGECTEIFWIEEKKTICLETLVHSGGSDFAHNANSLEVSVGELSNDLHLLLALLGLDQLVFALLHDGGLNSLAIHSGLLKLFTNLKSDHTSLQSGGSLDGVRVPIQRNLNRRLGGLGQVAQNEIHSQCLEKLVKVLTALQLVLADELDHD